MNNDYKKLKALLNSFGVEYREEEMTVKGITTREIVIEPGHRKVDGYPGFITRFTFTEFDFRDIYIYE